MASSNVLVLTSRVEGCSIVLLEAQNLGCPVITTKAGGAVDVVLDGKTGLLSEDENIWENILKILKYDGLEDVFPRQVQNLFQIIFQLSDG